MKTSKILFSIITLGALVALYSCDSSELVSEEAPKIKLESFDLQQPGVSVNSESEITSEYLDSINESLAAEGSNMRVMMAEYITAAESNEMGNTVLAKDVGNKQLGADFVPNDPRRVWSGPVTEGSDNITYIIDQVDAVPLSPGLTAEQTTEAITNAMTTWDNLTCSDLSVTRNADVADDLGFIAALNGLGGSFAVGADVQHAGFSDINFGGGVLGVAFTLTFIDAEGNPTDIDENGKIDVAFREIYYDPSWFWGIDGSEDFVDVESIALHEAGHGLSQAHFGKVSIKKNGELKTSPRAIMNAIYTGGASRELLGTDNGGHCSNWGQWPNN